MSAESTRLRFPVGCWVDVTVRRWGGPDLVMRGKVVEATRDYAIAECRKRDGGTIRFTSSEDTELSVSFRKLQGADFRQRKVRHA